MFYVPHIYGPQIRIPDQPWIMILPASSCLELQAGSVVHVGNPTSNRKFCHPKCLCLIALTFRSEGSCLGTTVVALQVLNPTLGTPEYNSPPQVTA